MEREWVRHLDPNNKYGGRFILGDPTIELPEGTIISVTRGEKFNMWRLIVNGILNQFVMKQLKNNPDLLFAELTGQLQGGIGQTLTVWKPGTMHKFRNSGAHKFSMKRFAWVFFSGNVEAYFHSWKSNGRIPSSDEACQLLKEKGRFYVGGKLIQKETALKKSSLRN